VPFTFKGLAPEIISILTGGAAAALPFIVHGVTAGLSANAIGEALQEAGLGVRRNSLLAAVRGVRESLTGAELVKGLGASELPDPSIFRGSYTFMQRPFAYVVQVFGTNATTGAEETRNITISSEEVLSNDDIEQYVGDILEASYSTYNLELDSYDVTQVLVDPRILP